MSPLNITQPLGIWSIMATIRRAMSNIPKMGHLPTPVILVSPHLQMPTDGDVESPR